MLGRRGKVGAVVLATHQGLGYLAKDFFDNGLIDFVYIRKHSSRENNWHWYPRESVVASYEALLEECDTLLFFETPFDWSLIPKAREKGVKTVLMPMYECTNFPIPYRPDRVICPSLLDLRYYGEGREDTLFLPVPVEATWKERQRARIFVHNAGNGGLGGRNGTKELLTAMKWVKSDIQLLIRTQSGEVTSDDPRVAIHRGQLPKEDLYAYGDVFIFPEKFNGLSLPLQEAFASGMMVMAGDRFPINTWLPTEPLIPVSGYTKEQLAVELDCAIIKPEDIASAIDSWFDKDIRKFSQLGKTFNKNYSWKALREKYEEVLSA